MLDEYSLNVVQLPRLNSQYLTQGSVVSPNCRIEAFPHRFAMYTCGTSFMWGSSLNTRNNTNTCGTSCMWGSSLNTRNNMWGCRDPGAPLDAFPHHLTPAFNLSITLVTLMSITTRWPASVCVRPGRKGRLVRQRQGAGGVKWEARNMSKSAVDRALLFFHYACSQYPC
jgi:hypothetical protein